MPKKIYPEEEKKLKNPLVKEVWESKIKQSPSKNKHISYSSYSTYQKCPKLWLYNLHYFEGLLNQKTEYLLDTRTKHLLLFC